MKWSIIHQCLEEQQTAVGWQKSKSKRKRLCQQRNQGSLTEENAGQPANGAAWMTCIFTG